MLQEVHGGRSLRYEAAFTRMKAKPRFPCARSAAQPIAQFLGWPAARSVARLPVRLSVRPSPVRSFIWPSVRSSVRSSVGTANSQDLYRSGPHHRSRMPCAKRHVEPTSLAWLPNTLSLKPGDLVLFNPREQATDHLPSKRSTDWLDHYRVIQQVKNNVSVKHIVLHTDGKFLVSRLKPFIGSEEQALEIALHDQHQFTIQSINIFTGNPFERMSTAYNTFGDSTSSTLPYGRDFIHSQQFDQYINSLPILFPLRCPAKIASSKVAELGKLAITTVQPGMEVFVDLRIHEGTRSTWFDSLSLLDNNRLYITRVILTKWCHRDHRMIVGAVPFFDPTILNTHCGLTRVILWPLLSWIGPTGRLFY